MIYFFLVDFTVPRNSAKRCITRQLEQEVTFYQKRIRQSPQDGLNQALLATVYLKLARATGDSNWYLLAEQAAQQSFNNLPFNNTERYSLKQSCRS